MANVEDAAQFRVELLFVVEIGVLPVHRMADRRLQTAFRTWISAGVLGLVVGSQALAK